MRGKGAVFNSAVPPFRITPAYAGKSSDDKAVIDFLGGSPPPMRGKVYQPLHQPHDERITPAYAGKSMTAISEYS